MPTPPPKRTGRGFSRLRLNTQGKTDCTEWHTDGWGGYERVLRDLESEHYINKALTQRVERTNGILRSSNRSLASTTEHERLAEE
ncbi:hypothetical protein B7486_53305 [cyanobacterium TDX16]|nr:hypothetical protein B7486_53305 [cyanobacterium TDX16]